MTWYIILIAAVCGLICGGFAASSICKISNGIKPFSASLCEGCGGKLKWYERIPVISFLASKGKRKCCGQKIPAENIVLPLIYAAVFVASALMFYGAYPIYAVLCALECGGFLAVATFDFLNKWIPDRYQIALLVIGVAAMFFAGPLTVVERLIGAAAGGGAFVLIYLFALLILKREGMGFGDVKLAFVAGLFVGWKGMIIGLIIGSVSAAVILLAVRKKNGDEKNTEYPFAPFLCTGFMISIFVSEILINAYMSLF